MKTRQFNKFLGKFFPTKKPPRKERASGQHLMVYRKISESIVDGTAVYQINGPTMRAEIIAPVSFEKFLFFNWTKGVEVDKV